MHEGEALPWMALAWADLGEIERSGSAANPRILSYWRHAGGPNVASDEVAWCAAFAFSCLKLGGVDISAVPEEHRGLANKALLIGTPIDEPRVGAICVLSRGSDPAQGHVGFVVGWTAEHVVLLGGNQANSVSTGHFARSRIRGLRWPVAQGAEASRIAAAARRQQKDAAKGTAPQMVPEPSVSSPPTVPADTPAPDVPPLDGLPPFPPLEQIPGKLGASQQAIEAAISFAQFVGHKWPLIMMAVSAYFFARMAYDAWRIRGWRISDALTGKTIGGGA